MLGPAAIVALLLSAGRVAPPELEWPHELEGEATKPPACAKALPQGTRTLLGIRIDEAKIDAFEVVLGASDLHREGDASTSFAWRCWEAANGDGTVLVVGRGEVHAELRVLGRGMKFERGTCPRSGRVSRALATANGVRVGLTGAEVVRKVGRATERGEGWFHRTCSSKQPLGEKDRLAVGAAPGESATVFSRITVVMRDGRVEGYRVMWGATY